MAPTLVNSYLVTAGPGTTTLTTPAFTPATGEVIVVKGGGSDAGITLGTVSGGSLTYTTRQNIGTAGSYCRSFLVSAIVGASPGSMSVSVTFGGSSLDHSAVVERWSNANLAGTPASIGVLLSVGVAPSTPITTVGADSVVSWVDTDWSASSPTGRAYRSSATEVSIHDVSPNQYVAYYAYQSASTAGSQTVGMTAPTQRSAICAIEILAGGPGYNPPTDIPTNIPVDPASAAQLVAIKGVPLSGFGG